MLIEAWASIKSFRPVDEEPPGEDGGRRRASRERRRSASRCRRAMALRCYRSGDRRMPASPATRTGELRALHAFEFLEQREILQGVHHRDDRVVLAVLGTHARLSTTTAAPVMRQQRTQPLCRRGTTTRPRGRDRQPSRPRGGNADQSRRPGAAGTNSSRLGVGSATAGTLCAMVFKKLAAAIQLAACAYAATTRASSWRSSEAALISASSRSRGRGAAAGSASSAAPRCRGFTTSAAPMSRISETMWRTPPQRPRDRRGMR